MVMSKEYAKIYNNNYYWDDHQNQLERARKYKNKNRQKMNQKYLQKYWSNPEVARLKRIKKYWNNVEHYRKKNREYRRNNPGSCRSYSLELQLAMNKVRKRDNNTCQWFECGLTHREAPIHIHHIFPRSQYPELELIEQYMICYCANHHGLWHRYRGDGLANFLSRTMEGV